MKKFLEIFRKVGGIEILRQYWRAHVLIFALLETVVVGFSKKSLEIVRLAVNNRVLSKMRKKYRLFISKYQERCQEPLKREHSNKVWVCWFQGLDEAPNLVQTCFKSLKNNLKNKDIVFLTQENYKEYVCFPDYIQNKIDRGIIKGAHMSDLLRLELLVRYGGTWIDATVFCSGDNIPDYMLNSELFVFQMLKPGLDGHSMSISNWFITSCTNNPILRLTRELLYDYWKKHDKLIDYFIFHTFFQLAIEAYPDEWNRVIPFSNSVPHILLLRLFKKFDIDTWEALKNMCCFHKLSYKFPVEEFEKKGTYYDILLNREQEYV